MTKILYGIEKRSKFPVLCIRKIVECSLNWATYTLSSLIAPLTFLMYTKMRNFVKRRNFRDFKRFNKRSHPIMGLAQK
jgi:hypothetical protein